MAGIQPKQEAYPLFYGGYKQVSSKLIEVPSNIHEVIAQNKYLKISERMAILIGILLPLIESVRRINQIVHLQNIKDWADDYILGIFFIIIAFNSIKKKKNSFFYLKIIWIVGTIGLLLSFLGQFIYYSSITGDPGIFTTTFVLVAKGIVLIYMVIGLTITVKADTRKPAANPR